ncbi:hypothetical protein [Mycetocola zhadangensis]|uniref:Uncharacterized protein n=1 Tax=Mycetocola zhadangensis TaxID=1164595 RepID=A0A3L7J582_9MICO|nr:hypothetical protein [Mycetocola zhadangensis]RLQ85777.1 hypothetical protein D9V28_02650 [Mycetocola zhadangensis]GGE85705.1 hypothetical protein GCM10011313_05220 [Mycetocola zhadangensis]
MADPGRLELILRKPTVGWFPKPTVIFNGRGQPAQWGTGTWQVSPTDPTEVTVFLFNRLWKFGRASVTISPGDHTPLLYRPPLFFVGPGRLARVSNESKKRMPLAR